MLRVQNRRRWLRMACVNGQSPRIMRDLSKDYGFVTDGGITCASLCKSQQLSYLELGGRDSLLLKN